MADRTDGDIDTLATRIAHIRTWTFVANRPDWLKDPAHWQARTREIEDSLSDALHERLTQRFVDRRTSALMKGMRDKDELNADIADDGSITVENHFVGRLKGFQFTLDTSADGVHEKATRAAATQVLARELGMRARRVAAAQNDAFKLTRDARILWRDDEVARVEAADDPLAPNVALIADEHLTEGDREKIVERLKTWLKSQITEKLKPLVDASSAGDLQGLGRGVAFRLKENFGALRRDTVADEIAALDQTARADLRKYGLRFGAFNIFFPAMLKPASADLAATLWLLKNPLAEGASSNLPRQGLTSAPVDAATPEALYRANGFHVCGPRAVRLDILERLADLIRPLLAWRSSPEKTDAPKGSTGDGGFRATDDMMSILGCSAAELGEVLKTLGFRVERRLVKKADAQPAVVAAAETLTQETAPTAVDAADAAPVGDAGPPDSSAPDASASVAAPAAETDANEAVAPPAVEAPPAEDVYEEIWKPRRHQRQEQGERAGANRRPSRDRRPHHQRRQEQAPAAAAATPPPAAAANASSPPLAAASAPPASELRDDKPLDGKRKPKWDGDKRPDQRPDQRSGHRGDQRNDRNAGDRGPRPSGGFNRGSDRPRRDEGRRQPEVITAAPPKRSGVDPDSPFAKLAALKASMDKDGAGSR